ncbi:MAG: PEP/pyruvate-binding domain-containing protein, partial [Actinomycetota bacterium]
MPTAWIVDVEELAAIERGGDAPAIDPGRTYAVRSSATVEDGEARSFAGQFASVLDVPGTAAALGEALRAVAASARTDAVAGYARAAGIDPASIRMAAVVQEMVPAVAAGIAFSTNPITGLEEVVVEAVAGGGEALAQDGATPSRWVDRFGALTERPDAGPIGDDVALAIGREVRRVAAAVGVPVDLEWVADGERVWWVQLRPITALARTPIYSNRISREVFPGMIAPFVWSLNTRFVNRAWHRLITRAIGPNAIDPDALARPFAFRAYFDMGAFGEVFASFGMPRRSMEMLLGLPTGEERPRMRPSAASLRKVPRLLALAGTALRFPGRVPRDLARLDARVAGIVATDPDGLDADALLRRIDDLSDVLRDYAWMNILGPFLQMGWTAALRRRADGAAEALDPGREAPERRAIDPGSAIADLAALLATLPADAPERLRAAGAEAVDDPRWREAWSGFLARFGHLSDRPNDCSVPSWREEPEVPLGLVLGHAPTTSAAASPHALEGSRAWRRAARARVQRETIGYGYARAYAAFRPTVLALGEHLRDRGAVAERDDVFLLDLAEVRALVAGGDVAARALVAQRRAAFADLRDLEMPETIVG